MAISHAGHNHPATPAGRRACRAGFDANPVRDLAVAAGLVKPRSRKAPAMPADFSEDAMIKLTGDVTRRMARTAAKADNMKAARIQPRKGGARVAARSSTCVQAALHVDAHGGRCACGWVAAA